MKRWLSLRSDRGRNPRARGTAIVEFAVVLPLLLTILFGIIEYGWIFMVRQTLQQAAREGVRVAVLQTSTDTDIDARVNQVMAPSNVSGYTIGKTHGGAPDWVETVTVTVSYSSVSLVGGFFGTPNYDMVGNASMRKEGQGGA